MNDDPHKSETTGSQQGFDAPFAFHDPAFVVWWLNSLYLFRPEDQIAIAELLAGAVHAPDAKAEIEAFVAVRTLEHIPAEAAAEGGPSSGTAVTAIDVVVARTRELWRANPWMVSLGLLAIAFFSAKAVFLLGRELIRIVF